MATDGCGRRARSREMVLSGKQELFTKYRTDRTPAAFDALVRACRPLVASVCWRYLRRPEDVDDAIQETFLKLTGAARDDLIHGDVESWLTATAYATSVDLIRRAVRERRRRAARGSMTGGPPALGDAEQRLVHEAIRLRLGEALLQLDEGSRELIVARFFRKAPLRVIAGARGLSVATLSRRTAGAVHDLAAVLRDMGIPSLDELTLAEHFGDPANLADYLELDAPSAGLRFAPDWAAPLYAPASSALTPAGRHWPGWKRRIRIGAFVSYLSFRTPGFQGGRHDIEDPVLATQFVTDPAFQLVAIAEAGTTDRGPVERTVRNYELTGGLIDATDAEELKTLDVILLGLNFAMEPAAAAAFVEAVRSGVGLLNEWWTATNASWRGDENVEALMLAATLAVPFHTQPHCGVLVTATARATHALLPGLRAGDRLVVNGCGPVYRPVEGAQVLIEKDFVISPEQHRVPGLGPARMPGFVVGQFGRGRVAAVQVAAARRRFAEHLGIPLHQYNANVLAWLAEPRREQS